jgi:hypothetical protein
MSNVGIQCITCSRFLACENCLKRQWNKPRSRCITCISQIDSAEDGKTIQQDHSTSNGLVDGHKHQVSNKERSDRAMRSSSNDQDK